MQSEPASGAGMYWGLGLLGVACFAAAGYLLWVETRPSTNPRGFDRVSDSRVTVAVGTGSTAGLDPGSSPGGTAPASGTNEDLEVVPAIEAPEPRVAARDLETRKPGEQARARSERNPRAASPKGDATAENKLFTLKLSGMLAETPLDPHDSQTWARLGYCLNEECPSRHWFVFPDGGVPTIQPPKSLLKTAPARPSARREPPQGDRSRPTYRLVLEARAQAAGKITFYGQEMASKYECRLTCTIEKRQAGTDDFVRLHVVTAEERVSPAKDTKDPPAELIRLCYDSALDRLAASLKAHAFFAGTTGPAVGLRKDPSKATRKK